MTASSRGGLAHRARAAFGAALALVMLSAVGITGAPSPAGAKPDGTRGRIAGLGISRPLVNIDSTLDDLPRMRAAGINTVAIDVWWYVDVPSGTVMHPGQITLSDSQLDEAIGRARDAHMKVMLEPKLWCPTCDHSWRGQLQPADRDAFFTGYRLFVNHYAALAQRDHVGIFMIGSEMSSLQNEDVQWHEVAREVRNVYSGQLTYEVNWDALDITYWDAVDIASVSAYFPLTETERPTLGDIEAAWQAPRPEAGGRSWFQAVRDVATFAHEPLLFGEAGYLSSTFAARRPWDPSDQNLLDTSLQADLYSGLLATFETQPWWAGVAWWEWYAGDTGTSLSYNPRDKSAEQLLTRWYVGGWRPPPPPPPPPTVPAEPTSTAAPASSLVAPLAPTTSASSADGATSPDVGAAFASADGALDDGASAASPGGTSRSRALRGRSVSGHGLGGPPPWLVAIALGVILAGAGVAARRFRTARAGPSGGGGGRPPA